MRGCLTEDVKNKYSITLKELGRMMTRPCNTHELKILPQWFADVLTGKKNFEIRRYDRDFKVGDYLLLKEWDRGYYTGREVKKRIKYIYEGYEDENYGLSDEFCILGLEDRQIGKWVGINEYLKHLKEDYGEEYKVSSLYDCSIFCNKCWSMSKSKTCYCSNCGVAMREEVEE